MSLQYVYFPLRQYKLYCEGVNKAFIKSFLLAVSVDGIQPSVVEALAHIHSVCDVGIIHRDVKPASH